MGMRELVIASFNTHKVYELREALKALIPHLEVLSLFDFPQYKREDIPLFDSFEDNAKAKAHHAAVALNKVCLADDSGIIIPALSTQRRYEHSKESATDQTKKLLNEMRLYKEMERHAFLECTLAIATPEKILKTATQRAEGFLAEEERGKITFEFDTIFVKHDYSKTIGELAPSVRTRISHRRKALEKLAPTIERLSF
jgi:XTP/dITP diphosphohydrolase